KEYGIAQISMNLTNISDTPVHIAFDEVCTKAGARGIRVTGSELVGLIPLKSMLDAGRYFLEKQQRSTGISDEELVKIAIKSLGLSDISKFNPREKIIEYVIRGDEDEGKLRSMTLKGFMNEAASESVAPGGGSVSAYLGSLGIALGTMVANISGHKRGWDHRWKEFSEWAEKGKEIQNKLLRFVDEDTEAFNMILEAIGLPRKTEEDTKARKAAIVEATKHATLVPFGVMETALPGFALIREMVEQGNPNSVTDAAVGALALRSCIRGAYLNVRINSVGLDDREFVNDIISRGKAIEEQAIREEESILGLTDRIIRERK
ncbi:MAG: cyclodeaminase/cyclohydrolase family protein, partial [Bacteroidales bacterium]|nr:cyclodeaminase/cyclohydrolase family protein [Bacteroidales bacterium]